MCSFLQSQLLPQNSPTRNRRIYENKKQFNLTLEKFISNSNCVIKVAGHIVYFISRPFNKEKLE